MFCSLFSWFFLPPTLFEDNFVSWKVQLLYWPYEHIFICMLFSIISGSKQVFVLCKALWVINSQDYNSHEGLQFLNLTQQLFIFGDSEGLLWINCCILVKSCTKYNEIDVVVRTRGFLGFKHNPTHDSCCISFWSVFCYNVLSLFMRPAFLPFLFTGFWFGIPYASFLLFYYILFAFNFSLSDQPTVYEADVN